MKTHLLAALAAIAGCSPAPGPSPETPTAPAAAPEEAPLGTLESLEGEYRVAGIDGAALDAPVGLVLTVTDRRIVFDGPCGGHAWDYRLAGTGLTTTRSASLDAGCLARTSIPRVAFDLAAAIDAAESAGRDRSNAVILAGGGHSVTLYSQ